MGSGNPAVKTWDFADFNRVQINSTFRAEITKGTAFKVTTTADDNVLPHVRVIKEGTTLKITLASGSYRLKDHPKAEITLPTLAASTSVAHQEARSKDSSLKKNSKSRCRARAASREVSGSKRRSSQSTAPAR